MTRTDYTAREVAALLRIPTVAQLLWSDAGQPAPTKRGIVSDAPCYICGKPSPTKTGVPTKDVFGPGFTDYDKCQYRASPVVCVPCVWLLGGKPPNTFRLFSVVYREDRRAAPSNDKAVYPHGPHTHCTSKSDVREIVDVLLDPPRTGGWACGIADSGQIHILPWCGVNEGAEAWTVRVEREDVTSTPHEFAGVLGHVAALLASGFIREDVETLDPHPSKLAKHGVDVWREHAEPLKQWSRSALLRLAINLTRKGTYGELRDRCAAVQSRGARPGAGDDGQREHGQDPRDGLVAAREGGADERGRVGVELGRHRHADGAPTPDRHDHARHGQGDLFHRDP